MGLIENQIRQLNTTKRLLLQGVLNIRPGFVNSTRRLFRRFSAYSKSSMVATTWGVGPWMRSDTNPPLMLGCWHCWKGMRICESVPASISIEIKEMRTVCGPKFSCWTLSTRDWTKGLQPVNNASLGQAHQQHLPTLPQEVSSYSVTSIEATHSNLGS